MERFGSPLVTFISSVYYCAQKSHFPGLSCKMLFTTENTALISSKASTEILKFNVWVEVLLKTLTCNFSVLCCSLNLNWKTLKQLFFA